MRVLDIGCGRGDVPIFVRRMYRVDRSSTVWEPWGDPNSTIGDCMRQRNRRKTARKRAAFKRKQKKRRLRAAGRPR
jgi:hypothetical protein